MKKSVQPTGSLGGFEVTPPVVLWLKCGSGPVYISRQHLVAVEGVSESEDEEKDVKLLSMSGKHSTPGCDSKVPQKKVKLLLMKMMRMMRKDDEDDEDDNDNYDFVDEEAEEKAPGKQSIGDSPAKNAQKIKTE